MFYFQQITVDSFKADGFLVTSNSSRNFVWVLDPLLKHENENLLSLAMNLVKEEWFFLLSSVTIKRNKWLHHKKVMRVIREKYSKRGIWFLNDFDIQMHYVDLISTRWRRDSAITVYTGHDLNYRDSILSRHCFKVKPNGKPFRFQHKLSSSHGELKP